MKIYMYIYNSIALKNSVNYLISSRKMFILYFGVWTVFNGSKAPLLIHSDKYNIRIEKYINN